MKKNNVKVIRVNAQSRSALEAAERSVHEEINRQARERRAAEDRAQALRRATRKWFELRDAFMNRLLAALIFAAGATILYNIGGIQVWVALPAVILAGIYTIIISAAYASRNMRKEAK